MEFDDFVYKLENLIDDLFHGALQLGNEESFSDLMDLEAMDDTRLIWGKELKEIYNTINKEANNAKRI